MKSTLLLGFGLIVSSLCFGKTVTYIEGDVLKASLHNPKEAEELYNSIDIEPIKARGGWVKSYRTPDSAVGVYCSKSSRPFGPPYSCTLSIDFSVESSAVATYQDNGRGVASINYGANALFDILQLKEHGGRSGVAKFFKTSDSGAEIYCTKKRIPVGIPYVCSVFIALP